MVLPQFFFVLFPIALHGAYLCGGHNGDNIEEKERCVNDKMNEKMAEPPEKPLFATLGTSFATLTSEKISTPYLTNVAVYAKIRIMTFDEMRNDILRATRLLNRRRHGLPMLTVKEDDDDYLLCRSCGNLYPVLCDCPLIGWRLRKNNL